MEPGGQLGGVIYTSQPAWNLIFDLIVTSRTPSRNSRYVWDSYHKITYDSLSTYLRIQYLSDHYPKTTHNSLRTNILLFVSESVTSLARWLLTISWHLSLWAFVFIRLFLFTQVYSNLSPELQFVRLQINSFLFTYFCIITIILINILVNKTWVWNIRFHCWLSVRSWAT